MADQPSCRRRFQFHLRTFFVIVVIVAVQFAVCLPMLKEWQELPATWTTVPTNEVNYLAALSVSVRRPAAGWRDWVTRRDVGGPYSRTFNVAPFDRAC